MKIVSPQASHKTEVGGVSLALARCGGGARRGRSHGGAARRARSASARVEGFLVQEMVDGLEMILGVREDPQFGPFMVAGLGGVTVEVAARTSRSASSRSTRKRRAT